MKKTLKDCCTLLTDGNWIESKDQSDSGIRLIQTGNVGNGEYLEKENRAKYISEETFLKLGCTEVFSGDILVSRLPDPVGRACIIPNKTERMITAVDCSILRVNESLVEKDYLSFFLMSPNYFNQLTGNLAGTTRVRISRKNLEKVSLNIPEISYQKKVANILGCVQTQIKKRKQQLSALDDLIKARFVEMFGDPIFNSKGLPTKKLGEICDLKSGDFTSADEIHDFQDDENPYPCYGGNGIRGYVNNYTHDGDFPIIGRQGALCGNVQYATGKFRNTEHAVLVTPINEINKVWLFELLTLENLYRFHTGAAQPGLAVKTLNTIDIPIADLKMQNAYAEFYKRIEKTKSTIQKALEQSQLLFDSLMQQYFG